MATHYRHARILAATAILGGLPNLVAAQTIGYINAGTEYFYQCQLKGVEYQAEQLGLELVTVNSDSNPQRQLANGQDLIARGVDVIILESADATTGQRVVELANEAGIPVVVAGISLGEPATEAARPTTSLTLDFEDMGALVAGWLNENRPNARLGIIQGLPGQGVIEGIHAGFMENLVDTVEILADQPADWNRQKASSVAMNMVTANPEIDTIYVHNEDMALGVLRALETIGREDIRLVSHNGTDDGVRMLQEGTLLATVAQSPVREGIISVNLALDIVSGRGVDTNVPYPLAIVTAESLPLEVPFCDLPQQ